MDLKPSSFTQITPITPPKVDEVLPTAAPLLSLEQDWQCSLFGRTIDQSQTMMSQIAQEADMAMGITDTFGTLLWTWSSQSMRSSAEQVHFVEGGQWSTQSVGTNAIGVALNTQQTSCVYSNENKMNSVQDWVCYATPIIDPNTQQYYGILNLSTQYTKHSNLGKLAVERCVQLLSQVLQHQQQDTLAMQVFGTPIITFNQNRLTLTHRQIEILAILALCPLGMQLDELHYALYGDREVSLTTLKAEISQLRTLLNGKIQPRCYRLNCELECDFLRAERALNAGYLQTAVHLYRGSFLTKTESPFLRAWRDAFDARLSHHIYHCTNPELLFKLIQHNPERIDAIERLLEILPEDSPYRTSLLQQQLQDV
ncbi:transcriptional regulator [Acinetobacter sp. MD2(2019)]|uniref:transcriptional regulator n=1 Tax=Acinetobacter sp. MD2(2019) TaxID=2605273 RepID=UPI002D79F872|nr:transcriptional regulator [Acinetobacter sp. MD2(2019)]